MKKALVIEFNFTFKYAFFTSDVKLICSYSVHLAKIKMKIRKLHFLISNEEQKGGNL